MLKRAGDYTFIPVDATDGKWRHELRYHWALLARPGLEWAGLD